MKRFLLLIALIISGMGLCAQNVGDNVSIDYVRYVLKFTVTSIEPAECEVVCTSKAASAPIVVKIPSTVTIGETEYNVTSLGYEAFRQKSISGVELPEGITSIGDYAFYSCTSLTEIEIPNTVVTIGDYAFYSCTSLTEIEIPNTVVTIGDYAFYDCAGLEKLNFEENSQLVTIRGYTFRGCTSLKTVIFEDNSQLDTIANQAFYNCGNLTTIDFGDNSQLRYIGVEAFYNYSNLRTIEFPSTITRIGNYAFNYCSQLRSVICNAVTPPEIDFYTFYNTNLSRVYVPAESVDIYESTYPWSIYTIEELPSETSHVPGSFATINYDGYSLDFIVTDVQNAKCEVICSTKPTVETSITIPSSVQIDGVDYTVASIGGGAFAYCSYLTSVEIPNTITSIGNWAFNACSNLTILELPSSITYIGSAPFHYSLLSLICNAETVPSGWDILSGTSQDLVVYVPASSIDLYKNDSEWNERTIKEISSSLPVEGSSEVVDYGNYSLKYTIRNNVELAECEVTCVEMPNVPTAIVIPSKVTIKGAEFDVTVVENEAFKDCANLTSIEIPSGVTSIGGYAFYGCSSLSSIEIPSGVTSIGGYAFYGCSSLSSIEIPSGVTSIGGYAFYGCSSLSSIEIPSGVTSIGYYTFYGCSSLSSIEIPSGVTYIGSYTFYGCSSLADVTFGENSQLTSIGSSAFEGCSSLASIEIPSGVTSIGSYAFEGCSSLSSIEIPSGVTFIDSGTFRGCSSLSSIEIPSGVTSIGSDAFGGCSSLSSIEIPSGVTFIDSYTFSGCSSLSSIEIPSGVTSIGSYAFYGCSSLASIEIPSGVTSIGGSAFTGCSSLASIEIPSGVTSIGDEAFYGCSSLADVTFGENSQLTSIGGSAFYGCSSLSSIEIPSGVTSIGGSAFYGCSSLTDVTFGENSQLTSIGTYAFYGCSSLADVTFGENSQLTSIGGCAFYGCSSLTSIEIPSGVTSIGSSAFYYCSSLETIIVEEGNPVYDSRGNCNALIETASNTLMLGCKNTIIPETVTTIGFSAFLDCSDLASIEIPSSVTIIGSNAFHSCQNLTNVTFAENSQLTSIGDYAFSYCTSLTSMELPNGIASIGSSAFNNCSGLMVFACLAETVPRTYSNSFSNLNTNMVIYVPESSLDLYKSSSPWNNYTIKEYTSSVGDVATIDYGTYSLMYVPKDTENPECEVFCAKKPTVETMVSVPSSVTLNGTEYAVTSIGKQAFFNCENITCLEIPATITYIGDEAFARAYYYNSGLRSMICHADSVPLTASSALNNHSNYSLYIYVPGTSVNLYKSVSPWKYQYVREYTTSTVQGATSTIAYGDYSLTFVVTDSDNKKCQLVSADVPTSGTEIVIPSTVAFGEDDCSVTSIGSSAFSGCSNLASIEIPSGVTSIGDEAFSNCSSLTSIEIPSGVTSIGDEAFYGCSNLASIEIPSGVTSIGDEAFYGCSSLADVTFGENSQLTSIESSAFYGCSSLTSIEIPSGVTSIGNYAFYGCSSLTSIEIPSGVTSIRYAAFRGCSSLENIVVEEDNTVYDSRGNCNALIVTESNTLLVGCRNTIIPETVTSIESSAFYGCSSLSSIEIPSGVTSIGSYAFSDCSSLSSIEIPSGVTSIGSGAFSDCSSLADVTFGENSQLTSIGDEAFYGCSNLASIEIPSGVTSIGDDAFRGCSSLSSIEIPSGVTSLEYSTFEGCSSLASVVFGENSQLTSIEWEAFYGCSSLSSIEIPSGVTSIGDDAFYGCSSLADVTFGENSQLTSIKSYAFSGCSSLASIEIPSGVTSIGYDAFYRCSSLASVIFEENSQLISIADYAFRDCSSLTSIEIPDGVASIGDYSFYSCDDLENVTIPSSVTSIGYHAFAYSSIKNFRCYAENVPQTDSQAFRSNSSMIVYVPEASIESYEMAIPWFNYIIMAIPTHSIDAVANPEIAGDVSGTGIYMDGLSATLNATPNFGYLFENWTENGEIVSTSAEYTFKVLEDKSLVANFFDAQSVLISINIEESGVVTGVGTYNSGDTVTVTATANEGYIFVNWTEDGEVVSTESEYSFVITEDRNLTANFIEIYDVTLSINIEGAGTVTGDGTYSNGSTVTVVATPNENYAFVSWTEDGEVVSTEAEYSFVITEDVELQANFIETYDVALSVNIEDSGVITGDGTYNNGETVTITATANEGYIFVNWTEDGEEVTAETEFTFVITEDRSFVANFIAIYDVTLSINIEGAGEVTGAGTFTDGDTVTVTATANEGYAFVNWTEDGEVVSTESEYSFEITEDRNLTANFIEIYDVTLSINIEGAGSVTGDGTYSNGSTVTVVATANEGYAFVSWTEDGEVVSTEAEYSFVITEDVELQANFIETYDVALSVNIEDSGVITGDGTYNNGETVTITATANEGYIFVNWTEDGEEVTAETEFTFVITEDRSFVANFIAIYDVTLSINIEGSGEVTGAGTFTDGETVTVTATTNEGYAFVNWTENGEVVSTESEYSFVITEDRNLTANFIEIYDVTLSINIEGSGSVTGDGTYSNGSTVTVVATPNENYAFVSWTEDGEVVSTEAEYSFVITEDVELQANFIETYDVALSVNIEDSGVITGDGTYNNGETVTLTATANEGYIFVNWTEDGEEVTAETEFTFVITEDRSFVANFIAIYDLVLSVNIEGAGEVTGAGTFTDGETVTITATTNEGYIFVNWTEDGEEVTAEKEFTFVITEDRSFVANFIAIYDLVLSVNIEGAGEVTGAGTFTDGETVTVTATANEGYEFVNWTEDGEVVSTEAEYSFVITGDMELVANFVEVEGVVEQYAQTLSLYPNPTNVNHPISLGMIYDKVEVYNSIGVRIADYSNVDSIDGMEAAGIYIIRVVNDKDVKFSRIVVR